MTDYDEFLAELSSGATEFTIVVPVAWLDRQFGFNVRKVRA
jgi:hypothetical protein